jgi:hypothetical protein
MAECHEGKGACEACLREKESTGEAGAGEVGLVQVESS